MKTLLVAGLLYGDRLTISGKPLSALRDVPDAPRGPDVIRGIDKFSPCTRRATWRS
jgi:hypothetical protein